MIWQLTPISRPHCVARVVAQFKAQSCRDKRLCVVMNGAAELCSVSADLVIRGGNSKPSALNLALEALRPKRVKVVIRDDDDWYLPDGLHEFDSLLDEHDIVGQLRHWIWDGANTWLVNRGLWNRPGHSKMWGGNIGFWSGDAVDVPDTAIGETHAWADAMVERGAKVWHKSPDHACLDRTQSDHLWQAPFTMVRYLSEGPAYRAAGWRPDLISGGSLTGMRAVARPTMTEAHKSELDRLMSA